MSKRALIYARVSYDDRKNEARNLEGQIEDGRGHCAERGHRIVAELKEDDRGASGADWDLPMLNQALEMARAGEFDVLVVRELDRFARSLAKQLVIEGEFKRHGVEIEYILGEYPDTPEGRLNKHIRATIAEFEREKIAQRMTRGRRQVVKSGKVMLHGNKPPYGYRVEDGILVIYEPEARIVRLIFTWYVYGNENGKKLSIKAIARRLTEMGTPTQTDRKGGYKKRGYGEWPEGTVADMLSNETYAGVWYYGKRDKNSRRNPRENWLSVEVPAIVSREVWEMAQERKEHNKEMASRNSKYEYLVGRRVTCGQCAHEKPYKMYGKPVQQGKYLYYTCPATNGQTAGQSCDNGYFRADQVDNAVWEWVRGILLHPEALRQDLKEQQAERERENQPLWDRLGVIDDLLADNRRKLEKLLDVYLSSDLSKETFVERKTRLETTITALEKERADLVITLESQTLTDAQILTIEKYARKVAKGLGKAEGDFELRRQIIDELDVRVKLAIEDGLKVAHVRCLIREEETLSIEDTITRNAWPET